MTLSGADDNRPRGYRSLDELLIGEGIIGKDGQPIPPDQQTPMPEPRLTAQDMRRAKAAMTGEDREESYETRLGRRDGERISAFYRALGHMPLQVAQALTAHYISARVWDQNHRHQEDNDE